MKKIRKEQIVQLREHDLNRGHNRSQTPVYPITVPESIEGLAEYLSNAGIAGTTTVDELPASGEEGKIYYNTSDGKYYVYSTNSGYDELGDTDIPIVNASDPNSEILHSYVYGTVASGSSVATANFNGSEDDFADGASATSMPALIEGDDIILTRDPQGFYLECGKFYDLGTISADTLDAEFETQGNPSSFTDIPGGLRLFCIGDSDEYVKEYMGRFTVAMGTAATMNLIIGSSIGITIPDDTPDLEDGHTYEFNVSASVLAIKDITYTTP